jgi:hypothetical protein
MASCSGKQSSHSKGTQRHCVVEGRADHSFEIYLPAGYDSTKNYPVIFSFDSHGNGSTAITGFKQGADRFGFILVGSNLIRNGIPDYEKLITSLISDVKSHFPIDSRAVYSAGFSGGARMANYYGLQNQLTGIISCGAGFRQADIARTGVLSYVYNIAGSRDCNYGETAYLPGSLECTADKYLSESITGIHEWPNTTVLTQAIEFMYTRLLIDKIRDSKPVSISTILDEKKAEIDSLSKTNNKYELYKRLEKASKMFAGTSDGTDFSDKMKAMDQDKAFTESLRPKEQALQMESMLNQGYVKAIKDESLVWWTNELKALNDSIRSNHKSDLIDMMFRTKAYIGMICFSYTSDAAKKKDIPTLEKQLAIYQMAEPQNPDVYYYKSIYYLLKNQKDSVFSNIKKAYSLGFEDSVRLRSDFPVEIIQQINQSAAHRH